MNPDEREAFLTYLEELTWDVLQDHEERLKRLEEGR